MLLNNLTLLSVLGAACASQMRPRGDMNWNNQYPTKTETQTYTRTKDCYPTTVTVTWTTTVVDKYTDTKTTTYTSTATPSCTAKYYSWDSGKNNWNSWTGNYNGGDKKNRWGS